MNPNSPGSIPVNDKIQSFLENLRASRSGNSFPNKFEDTGHNPFKEIKLKKEIEKKRIEQFHQARQQEWNRVYSAKEREKDSKIEQIRIQLKNLANQLKVLDKNITNAIENPVLSGGSYDESFFTHIQKTIHIFSQSVNNTNTWLQLHASRNGKKGYYWNMAKSNGTSFTQNNERSVATSVG